REPLQALGAGWDVLALVLVGAWDEIGVELCRGHEPAQLLDAGGGGAALGGSFEGLEHKPCLFGSRRLGNLALWSAALAQRQRRPAGDAPMLNEGECV